jgi:hypothetical protein
LGGHGGHRPLGSQDQFGSGKWQLAPTVAGHAHLPEVCKGSFLPPVVCELFSIAGQHERREISDLVIQPVLNWQLPDRWSIAMSPEIRFNLKGHGDAFAVQYRRRNVACARSSCPSKVHVPIIEDYPQ